MIRLAEPADVARISQLWAETVAYHAQFDADTFRAADNGAEAYARFVEDGLRDANARLLVAEMDGELVGYISGAIAGIAAEMFLPLRFDYGYLRRRGIGRALVERLALWFRAQGIDYFQWHVSAQNLPALGFWWAIGGVTTILHMRVAIPGDDK